MSWTYSGTALVLGGGSNLMTVPTVNAGDLLVISAIGDTGSTPSGFTLLAAHGTHPARLWAKTATASEPATYTFSGLQTAGSAILLVYSRALLAGAAVGSWLADVVGSPAATVAPTAAATTIDSALLVSAHGVLNSGTVPNATGPVFGGTPNLSGQAIRRDLFADMEFSSYYGHCVVDAIVTPIGATTSMLVDWAGGGITPTDIGVGIQAVFKPVFGPSVDASGRFIDATLRGRFV